MRQQPGCPKRRSARHRVMTSNQYGLCTDARMVSESFVRLWAPYHEAFPQRGIQLLHGHAMPVSRIFAAGRGSGGRIGATAGTARPPARGETIGIRRHNQSRRVGVQARGRKLTATARVNLASGVLRCAPQVLSLALLAFRRRTAGCYPRIGPLSARDVVLK